jgi:(p)ppGpp synthase/HD superfamily hydrolase
MKYPVEFQNILDKAKTITGMSLGEYNDYYDKMLLIAQSLVKEKITGERKGLPGELNYTHSIRVHDLVSKLHHWDDPDWELFLAALLHDIVEDGGVSFTELADNGFSRRTIELIYLCTHDKVIENKAERWALMIAKLIQAKDEEAWYIKLMDLSDNLSQCKGLTEENRKFMLEVKAPLMLRLTEWTGRGYHSYLEEALEKALHENKIDSFAEAMVKNLNKNVKSETDQIAD